MNGNLAGLLAGYQPAALARALDDDDDCAHVIVAFPSVPRVIRRLQSGLAPTTDDQRSFAWDLTSALGMAEHRGRRVGEQ